MWKTKRSEGLETGGAIASNVAPPDPLTATYFVGCSAWISSVPSKAYGMSARETVSAWARRTTSSGSLPQTYYLLSRCVRMESNYVAHWHRSHRDYRLGPDLQHLCGEVVWTWKRKCFIQTNVTSSYIFALIHLDPKMMWVSWWKINAFICRFLISAS